MQTEKYTTAVIPASGYPGRGWMMGAWGFPWGGESSIRLGEEGRGRTLRVVPLAATSERVNVVSIERKRLVGGAEMLTLNEEPGVDLPSSALVVVSANAPYSRHGAGTISPVLGAEVIADGMCAAGAAGRVGSAQEALVVMPVGSAVIVRPFGRARARIVVALGAGEFGCVTTATSPDLPRVDACWRAAGGRILSDGESLLQGWWGVSW